jgi:hypothetical protein
MPVDKAWEEYRESDDWVRDDDEKPYREGYFEGQKSLSPEVREEITRIINMIIAKDKIELFGDGIKTRYYCAFCLTNTAEEKSKVMHDKNCIIPRLEKLLAKE